MAVTFPVVVKITGSNVSSITSSAFTSVAGSSMSVASSADTTINTPTDTNGDAFGTAKSNLTVTSIRAAVWEKDNVVGGAGNTVNITYGAATYPTAYVVEARGVDAAAYDSGSANFGTSTSGTPFSRPTLGQAQAANGVVTFCFTDAGTISGFTCSGYTVTQETDTSNFWCGAVGVQVVNTTAAVPASWAIAPGASAAITFTYALKEASASSTFDVAESSAGTEVEDRTLAITGAGAESSAGTDAPNRTVALAPGNVAESSAGTDAENRTLAVPGAVAETAAGTTAQDFSAAATGSVAESSAGTTTQTATVAVGPLAAAESSAGTTAQDFTPGTVLSVAESSTPSTSQDRNTPTVPSMAVAESSAGTAAQDRTITPPAGAGSSGTRRWVVSYYEDYFARKAAEAAKVPEQSKIKKTRVKKKNTAIIAGVAEPVVQVQEQIFNVQRDREQAELDDEDILLLSAL